MTDTLNSDAQKPPEPEFKALDDRGGINWRDLVPDFIEDYFKDNPPSDKPHNGSCQWVPNNTADTKLGR